MKNKQTLIALATLTFASSPIFASVTLTGDPTTTTGFTFQNLGNSQDAAIKADSVGSGYSYDVYYGTYTVSAGDSVSGTNVIGNTTQGAAGGSFDVGDQILVIGWKAGTQAVGVDTGNENNGFLKFDFNNNGGYSTDAESSGSPSTSFSDSNNSDPGDFQLMTSRNSGNEHRVAHFRFRDNTSPSIYPLQVGGGSGAAFIDDLEDLPFRTFGSLDSGTAGSSSETIDSQLILLNVTDLNASSFNGVDVNDFGGPWQFYMQLGNKDGTLDSNTHATGVVVAVPEPTSLALLGLGGLIAMRRRR